MQTVFESRVAAVACQLMGRAAHLPLPPTLLGPLVRAYSFGFGVDLEAAAVPSSGYGCFGDFFARELKPGVRPISQDREAVVGPCDGLVVGCGKVSPGSTFEVKGRRYDAASLLGNLRSADRMAGGGFIVVYLHPRDYHRVHAPADATLQVTRHIPGARYPVGPWTTERIDDIYGKNERLVFELSTANGGALCVAMVAAFGVGGLASPYAPQPGRLMSERAMSPAVHLDRGEEIGAFRLGSTVVLLWSQGAVSLDEGMTGARMLVGRRIGRAPAMSVSERQE